MPPNRRAMLSMFALAPAIGLLGTARAEPHPAGKLIVLVRHAEKADDDPRDPSLSAPGNDRVAALTDLLAPLPLTQVLVTSLQRTRLTAEPAASAHGLTPVAVPFADTLTEHARATAELALGTTAGAVSLIVGHSNTLPLVISELGGPSVEISEERYVDLFLLLPQSTGAPWFLRASYGCAGA